MVVDVSVPILTELLHAPKYDVLLRVAEFVQFLFVKSKIMSSTFK
jgi:hypothetical protein